MKGLSDDILPAPAAATAGLARLRLHFAGEHGHAHEAVPSHVWRSAFGMHLRRQLCLTGAASCEGCHLRARCPYPLIMETRVDGRHSLLAEGGETPRPYMLRPIVVPPGEAGCMWLELTLLGSACQHASQVIAALKAAAAGGLGPHRTRWQLEQVQALDEMDGAQPWTPGQAPPMPFAIPPVPSGVRLRLETPLRLRLHGRELRPERFSLPLFVAALLRRQSLLHQCFGIPAAAPTTAQAQQLIGHSERLRLSETSLRWESRQRWSSRQQRRIPIGGLLGGFRIDGELAPLWPWLWRGQWLHLGKSAVMGLGCYRLQVLRAPLTWLVSRHPGAIAFLRRQGHHFDRQVDHVDLDAVQAGDTIIGTLPVNLAAEACRRGARYLHLSLKLPSSLRGTELASDDLEQLGARLDEFHVEAIPPSDS